jgi:hypothetical protein
MAITIQRAYQIVCSNATLTQSARLQISEKYMFYRDHRDELEKELSKVQSVISKIDRILQIDEGLKVSISHSSYRNK